MAHLWPAGSDAPTYGICIAADNAAFKPGYNLADDRNVIVNGQEGQIRHFGVDAGVQAFFIDCIAKGNAVSLTFKNHAVFFPVTAFL